MHLYLDLLTKGEHLYDYKGNEFLSANDAYDFAETTVEVLKNELDGAWSGWSVEVRNAEGRKFFSTDSLPNRIRQLVRTTTVR